MPTSITSAVTEPSQRRWTCARCLAASRWQDSTRCARAAPARAGNGTAFDSASCIRRRATESDNDSSCVLSIDDGGRRAMLPGDITVNGEQALPYRSLGSPIDFLLAAHHGSRSSSSAPFVAWSQPRIVVFSAGFMNRFGHPHRDVVCRFAAAGSRTLSTARAGAVTWRSDQPATVIRVATSVAPLLARQWIGGRSVHRD